MTTEQQNAFNFLRRGDSTTTQKVVVEKPVIKEIIREVEVEKDCPPCPECPNIPIHIDTLHIKSDVIIVKNNCIFLGCNGRTMTLLKSLFFNGDN